MKISDYNIIKAIAKGAFSTVFLAEKNNKYFVIKKIDKYIENFNKIINEINSLMIMNNYPNCIKFYEAKKEKNYIFLVFDYVEGGDLNYQILNNNIMDFIEAKKLILDIIGQLKFIHLNKRLHHDITPFNIVKKEDTYFLIDWGISSNLENQSILHYGHKIYTAPEIFRNIKNLSSDIYSLGCCLYFVLTKNNIFDLKEKDTHLTKIFKHFYFKPNIDLVKNGKFKYLLLRMLEKDYKRRADFDEIENILKDDFIVPSNYLFDIDESYENYDSNNQYLICEKLASDNVYFMNETLGLFYEDGLYVKQDLAKSFITYRKGFELNFIPSISSLGVLYFKGKGVKQDFIKAYELFKKSSTFCKSQFFLGLMIEQNLCKDEYDYIYWYKLAAFEGFELAVKKVIDLKIEIEFEPILIK